MSRRKSAVKRLVLPDARYDSQTVSKFINCMMYEGKKSTAERMFYTAMDLVENRTSQPGVTVFVQGLVTRSCEPLITIFVGPTYRQPRGDAALLVSALSPRFVDGRLTFLMVFGSPARLKAVPEVEPQVSLR